MDKSDGGFYDIEEEMKSCRSGKPVDCLLFECASQGLGQTQIGRMSSTIGAVLTLER